MKEEEITYRIRKYYLAKKLGTLDKEYPVVGNIKDKTGIGKLIALFLSTITKEI